MFKNSSGSLGGLYMIFWKNSKAENGYGFGMSESYLVI